MTLQHKNQRVAIFIDVQNMYYSAKQLFYAKVNFANILKEGLAGRKLIRAIAYSIKADIKDEHVFFSALENIGIEVKVKELQVFYGGAKKGDWDIGIAMDMIRLAPKVDCAILVSGDGDFTELIKYLKSMGCRTEVMAFRQTASSMLINEADMFTDLSSDPKKFLIPIKDSKDSKHLNKPKAGKKSAKKSTAVFAEVKPQPLPVPKGAELIKDGQSQKPVQPQVSETKTSAKKTSVIKKLKKLAKGDKDA